MKRYYFRCIYNNVDTEIDEEDYNNYKKQPNTFCNVMYLENDELFCEVDRHKDNCLNVLCHYNTDYDTKNKELLYQYATLRARKIVNGYNLFLRDAVKKFLAGTLKTQYTLQNYRRFDKIHYDYYVCNTSLEELEGKYWMIDYNMIRIFLEVCDAVAATYIRMRRLHTTMDFKEFALYTNKEMLDNIIECKIKECGDYDKIL